MDSGFCVLAGSMRAVGLDVPVVDELTSLVGEASLIGIAFMEFKPWVQCAWHHVIGIRPALGLA
jgi:hypothetical protein